MLMKYRLFSVTPNYDDTETVTWHRTFDNADDAIDYVESMFDINDILYVKIETEHGGVKEILWE